MQNRCKKEERRKAYLKRRNEKLVQVTVALISQPRGRLLKGVNTREKKLAQKEQDEKIDMGRRGRVKRTIWGGATRDKTNSVKTKD